MICKKCNKIIEENNDNLEISIIDKNGYTLYSYYFICPFCGEKNWGGDDEIKNDFNFVSIL